MVRFNILSLLFILVCKNAHALTNLRQVQLTESNRLTLVFDSKVDPRQYNVEFFKDTIQVTFQDASVYPPKISTLNSPYLSKTFAYQYSPSTVRFRMTVKGDAEDYRDHVTLKASGKLLNIDLSKVKSAGMPSKSSVASDIAKDSKNQQKTSGSSDSGGNSENAQNSKDVKDAKDSQIDEELLAKVKNGAPTTPDTAGTPEKTSKDVSQDSKESDADQKIASKAKLKTDVTGSSEQNTSVSLTGNASKTPFPSFKRTLIMLSLVVGIFLMFALVLKKWVKTKDGKKSKQPKFSNSSKNSSKSQNLTEMIASSLGKSLSKNFLKSKSGSGAVSQNDEIELISVKELGPSQSIALVRIGNQELVLGIADGSINVISTKGVSSNQDDSNLQDLDEPEDYYDHDTQINLSNRSNRSERTEAADRLDRPEQKKSIQAGANRLPLDNAFGDLLNREVSAPKFSARDRIRSRLEGMKQL